MPAARCEFWLFLLPRQGRAGLARGPQGAVEAVPSHTFPRLAALIPYWDMILPLKYQWPFRKKKKIFFNEMSVPGANNHCPLNVCDSTPHPALRWRHWVCRFLA